MLRLEIEKDNILTNWEILLIEKVEYEDHIYLLHKIIQVKAKEVVEAKILQKGDDPLFEWK